MKRSILGGFVLAGVQGALVASLAGQYALDRERLPRAWVAARPEATDRPVRGRYLHVPVAPLADAGLAPEIELLGERRISRPQPVILEARAGRLLAHKAPASHVSLVLPRNRQDAEPVLSPPIEYFVPPAAGDPARLLQDGELWIEVSVPARGAPRALRLGRMREGKIEPLG